MKRLFSVLLSLFTGIAALSQTSYDDVAAMARDSRVSLDFSCIVTLEEEMECKGSAIIQEDCFLVKGSTFRIICDGEVIYFLDTYRHEAYIENASSLESYIKENASSVSGIQLKNVVKKALSDDRKTFRFNPSSLDETWTVTDLRENIPSDQGN